MSTKLFLFRHGETQANIEQRYQGQTNAELTELGIKQAGQLSEALKNQEFSAVYSSTLTRSFNTAGFIAKKHALEVIQIPELVERDYGDWENLTFTDIKEKYPDIYDKWMLDPGKTIIPKAETLKELQARGINAINKLIEKHKNETIAVVGHGGINRTILLDYLRTDLNNFWRIKQDNCCINIVEFSHIPIVTLLNSTGFLGKKKDTVIY